MALKDIKNDPARSSGPQGPAGLWKGQMSDSEGKTSLLQRPQARKGSVHFEDDVRPSVGQHAASDTQASANRPQFSPKAHSTSKTSFFSDPTTNGDNQGPNSEVALSCTNKYFSTPMTAKGRAKKKLSPVMEVETEHSAARGRTDDEAHAMDEEHGNPQGVDAPHYGSPLETPLYRNSFAMECQEIVKQIKGSENDQVSPGKRKAAELDVSCIDSEPPPYDCTPMKSLLVWEVSKMISSLDNSLANESASLFGESLLDLERTDMQLQEFNISDCGPRNVKGHSASDSVMEEISYSVDGGGCVKRQKMAPASPGKPSINASPANRSAASGRRQKSPFPLSVCRVMEERGALNVTGELRYEGAHNSCELEVIPSHCPALLMEQEMIKPCASTTQDINELVNTTQDIDPASQPFPALNTTEVIELLPQSVCNITQEIALLTKEDGIANTTVEIKATNVMQHTMSILREVTTAASTTWVEEPPPSAAIAQDGASFNIGEPLANTTQVMILTGDTTQDIVSNNEGIIINTTQVSNNDVINTNQVSNNDVINTNQVSNNDVIHTNQVSNNDVINTTQVSNNDVIHTNQVSNNDVIHTNQVSNNDVINTTQVSNNDIINTTHVSNNDVLNTTQVSNNDVLNTNQVSNKDVINTNQVSNDIIHTNQVSNNDVINTNQVSNNDVINTNQVSNNDLLNTIQVSNNIINTTQASNDEGNVVNTIQVSNVDMINTTQVSNNEGNVVNTTQVFNIDIINTTQVSNNEGNIINTTQVIDVVPQYSPQGPSPCESSSSANITQVIQPAPDGSGNRTQDLVLVPDVGRDKGSANISLTGAENIADPASTVEVCDGPIGSAHDESQMLDTESKDLPPAKQQVVAMEVPAPHNVPSPTGDRSGRATQLPEGAHDYVVSPGPVHVVNENGKLTVSGKDCLDVSLCPLSPQQEIIINKVNDLNVTPVEKQTPKAHPNAGHGSQTKPNSQDRSSNEGGSDVQNCSFGSSPNEGSPSKAPKGRLLASESYSMIQEEENVHDVSVFSAGSLSFVTSTPVPGLSNFQFQKVCKDSEGQDPNVSLGCLAEPPQQKDLLEDCKTTQSKLMVARSDVCRPPSKVVPGFPASVQRPVLQPQMSGIPSARRSLAMFNNPPGQGKEPALSKIPPRGIPGRGAIRPPLARQSLPRAGTGSLKQSLEGKVGVPSKIAGGNFRTPKVATAKQRPVAPPSHLPGAPLLVNTPSQICAPSSGGLAGTQTVTSDLQDPSTGVHTAPASGLKSFLPRAGSAQHPPLPVSSQKVPLKPKSNLPGVPVRRTQRELPVLGSQKKVAPVKAGGLPVKQVKPPSAVTQAPPSKDAAVSKVTGKANIPTTRTQQMKEPSERLPPPPMESANLPLPEMLEVESCRHLQNCGDCQRRQENLLLELEDLRRQLAGYRGDGTADRPV